MNVRLMNEVEELEEIIGVCCAQPQGDELPQVATQHELIMSVINETEPDNAVSI